MNVAEAKIWGVLAGAVVWDEKSGYAVFEYDSAFVNKGWDLAPLMMPLSKAQRPFLFPELKKEQQSEFDTFKGLPGLLADVLPDKYGNQLINIWLAQQGRPPNSMNPVEMLCFIGSRGMGALEFEPPSHKERKRTDAIEIDSLVEIAAKMLSEREQFVTSMDTDQKKAVQEILRIGTSAGGARPKALIAFNEESGEVRSGQTNVPKGYEHWLIKLDGVSDVQLGNTHGYGRVEMAYYLMAIDAGIDMMPSRLLEENGRAHFMTKRFDREPDGARHHIQTFCAMKHFDFNLVISFSYEQLFQTMRELRLPYPQAEQLFRRMVFNVLARNCDDHTKNFAFRLRKNSDWELAPAYDICHAYQPNHRWVSQHALSINGKRSTITRDDFMAVAKSMNIKKAKNIIDQISDVVTHWNDYAKKIEVAPNIRKEIGATLIKKI